MRLFHTFALLVVMVSLLSWVTPALAEDSDYPTHVMTVTVSDKYEESNNAEGVDSAEEGDGASSSGMQYVIAEQTRYELLETTTYVNKQGVEITPDTLPVPCKARISFQILSNGTRNLLSLKVLRKLSGATTNWSELPIE
ncbi:hypothetical protein [Desulfogranum japonicum]|uniref:hypothetical protein n=1 Tax=Desulfogranum japonicum TaxID=231447 RepID=UPI0004273B63|nr:hypothetical protein [Desulfogranum japonicum]